MAYIPDVGDIVWLHFSPQQGHEQAGHRPALVLTPKAYNDKTSLMLCCPLTTQIKGYPFEMVVSSSPPRLASAWGGEKIHGEKRMFQGSTGKN
jgi:mRNA interferase MazF